MIPYIKILFKIPINIFRIVFSLPFEILKTPIILIAKLVKWITLILIGVALYHFVTGKPLPHFEMRQFYTICGIFVGALLIDVYFLRFLGWFNPVHKWEREKEEEAYFEQNYRSEVYSWNRLKADTGIDVIADNREHMEMLRSIAYNQQLVTEELRLARENRRRNPELSSDSSGRLEEMISGERIQ